MLILGFVLAVAMAILQSACLQPLVLYSFAPFVALALLKISFYSALWAAALAGLLLDLLSSDPFGLHAISCVLTTASLYRFRRLFKDHLLQLCLYTALVSLAMGLFDLFLFFLFDRRVPAQGQSLLLEFLLMPLVDAAYAFFWFVGPLQILEWSCTQWKLWRLKKNGPA